MGPSASAVNEGVVKKVLLSYSYVAMWIMLSFERVKLPLDREPSMATSTAGESIIGGDEVGEVDQLWRWSRRGISVVEMESATPISGEDGVGEDRLVVEMALIEP